MLGADTKKTSQRIRQFSWRVGMLVTCWFAMMTGLLQAETIEENSYCLPPDVQKEFLQRFQTIQQTKTTEFKVFDLNVQAHSLSLTILSGERQLLLRAHRPSGNQKNDWQIFAYSASPPTLSSEIPAPLWQLLHEIDKNWEQSPWVTCGRPRDPNQQEQKPSFSGSDDSPIPSLPESEVLLFRVATQYVMIAYGVTAFVLLLFLLYALRLALRKSPPDSQ